MAYNRPFGRSYGRPPFSWQTHRSRSLWVVLGLAIVMAVRLFTEQDGNSTVATHDPAPSSGSEQTVAGSFPICSRHPFTNCVVDGDTFYLDRQPVRIEDIDAPETHPSRCDYEAKLGNRATERFHELLSQAPFELELKGRRDHDQYGRELRTVVRDGQSIGSIMVSEGLARRWTGHRLPWCN